MGDVEKRSTFSANPDIELFAEDFVNYILLKFKLPSLSSGIAIHRDTIYNAFTPAVKIVANYDCFSLRENIFQEFANIKKERGSWVRVSDFEDYYDFRLRFKTVEQTRSNRSRAKKLIEFCVKISRMAVEFYKIGIETAPGLAVKYIIDVVNDINLEKEEIWKALNEVSVDYAKRLLGMKKYNLTPKEFTERFESLRTESSEWSSTELDTSDSSKKDSSGSPSSSKGSSEDSRSTDHEIQEGNMQCELSEKSTSSDFCYMHVDAISSDESVLLNSSSRHVEKTVEEMSGNIGSKLNDASEHDTSHGRLSNDMSGCYNAENSETSSHSYEVTSSEDDSSKPKIRKKRKKPCSYSENSTSDSDKHDKNPETTHKTDHVCGQLIKKHSAIYSSSENELS